MFLIGTATPYSWSRPFEWLTLCIKVTIPIKYRRPGDSECYTTRTVCVCTRECAHTVGFRGDHGICFQHLHLVMKPF